MIWRNIWPGLLAAAAALAPAGAAAQGMVAGPVELSQPWAPPAAAGGDATVMMTIHNAGDVRDDLLHAACATAESAELVGPPAPGAAPAHIDGVPVQPGQTVIFTPDTIRLVLHHLAQPLRAGDTLHCTATFAKTGERLFEAAIRPQAPAPAP